MVVETSAIQTSVTGAIRQAAQVTGADFRYLFATAQVESNLNPNARVAASSARGLFQFIEQTWLATLKEQGPRLGYGPYANAIARLPSGEYAVSDPRMRNAIMNLRADPNANAVMAGAFTRVNAGKLASQLGRGPSEGELYIAHFLGAAGAGRLIELAGSQPGTPAAAAFPKAARANPSIFYDRQGHPRGAADVYRTLVGRYHVARGGEPNSLATARAGEPPARSPTPPMPTLLALNDTTAQPVPTASDAVGSVFHGLFRTDARQQAVAPVVSALWSAPASPPAPASATRPAPASATRPAPASATRPAPASASRAAPAAGRRSGPAEGGALALFQAFLHTLRAAFGGRV